MSGSELPTSGCELPMSGRGHSPVEVQYDVTDVVVDQQYQDQHHSKHQQHSDSP